MQALFENPLAEPGLLGVSNGAGVGLIAAVMLGGGELSGWSISLSAILGALLITSSFCALPDGTYRPAVCCLPAWRWGSSAAR
jgi:ABC-type cobalamin transport system permease subunit